MTDRIKKQIRWDMEHEYGIKPMNANALKSSSRWFKWFTIIFTAFITCLIFWALYYSLNNWGWGEEQRQVERP